MAQGTGPQRLARLIESEWSASRAGRADVPDTIKYQTGGETPALNRGVLVLQDRESVDIDYSKHDLIHVYHPEAAPPVQEDNGYKEVRVVETVQIDIELTDRPDRENPPGRLDANERMTGLRSYSDGSAFDTTFDVSFESDPGDMPYRGIWGEVRYLLETVRRGLDEWDTVRQSPVNIYLGNSNANVSINVELEQIARNTVQ